MGLSGEKRSGSNLCGSGKILGFMCSPPRHMNIDVPAGTVHGPAEATWPFSMTIEDIVVCTSTTQFHLLAVIKMTKQHRVINKLL